MTDGTIRTFVASKNAGKLTELRALFAHSPLALETYPGYADVAEDATSYLGNAALKAKALAKQLRAEGIEAAVLSDDSGLEVDALGGRPGVHSARYAGIESSWQQRRALLLSELDGVPFERRGGRFVCVMTLLVPGEELAASIGVVEGSIAETESGSSGFGYDPIFFYARRNRTFAELTFEEKNALSHRARAARAMVASLRARA